MTSEWRIEILEVTTEDGETVTDVSDSEIFQEADEIFYSVETPDGEKHYRYIYGPYDSEQDVIHAIEAESDFYADVS